LVNYYTQRNLVVTHTRGLRRVYHFSDRANQLRALCDALTRPAGVDIESWRSDFMHRSVEFCAACELLARER
jgi:hypothetical protein